MKKSNHQWCNPLELAASLQKDAASFIFLYSSLATSYSGGLSWIALEADEIREELPADLADAQKWFGYLSYELENIVDCTELWNNQPCWIKTPAICFVNFKRILCFDHQQKTLQEFHQAENALAIDEIVNQEFSCQPHSKIKSLNCTLPKNEYLAVVEKTIAAIHAGDFYQANITRKYYGEFVETPDDFSIFTRLCKFSPAPYSAFLRINNTCIISSSPELFLKITADGQINTRPIKGTQSINSPINNLGSSSKDRAENLMIVDLMRNDLAKVCKIGSVKIGGLYEVDNFSTLRHLSSDINGVLEDNISPASAVLSCLPPGSMTGAPKRRAIEWCAQHEKMRRGIYSGCLGWISNQEAELSVIIRTIILQNNRFEFQVGGGIVADSICENELQETLIKAKGVATALGINEEDLDF